MIILSLAGENKQSAEKKRRDDLAAVARSELQPSLESRLSAAPIFDRCGEAVFTG